MRQSVRWSVVASLALAPMGLSVSPTFAANTDVSAKTSVTTENHFALPDGIKAQKSNDDTDIRKALGDVVGSALKKDGFSGVVDRFVDQDRTRLKNYNEKDSDKLNQLVANFRSDWKSKYGKDFDINDNEKVMAFSGVAILTGQIQNPDKLVGNWPIKQAADVSVEDRAQPAASKQDIEQAKNKHFGGDVNLEKGRKVAVVKVPSALGLPEVNCSLIHEKTGGWRLDIPNDITGQQLHDNLVNHLQMLVDHKDQWPSNVDRAYGMTAHHVIEAVYGIETASGHNSAK